MSGLRWHKSSYSFHEANCVEVAMDWLKSSHSMGNGNCVEVATHPSRVAVRDSKDPGGPVLVFTPGQWDSFVSSVRSTV